MPASNRRKVDPAFGQAVNQARLALGWSRQTLADAAGIQKAATIRDLEIGLRPRFETYRRVRDAIAKATNKPFDLCYPASLPSSSAPCNVGTADAEDWRALAVSSQPP